MQVLLILLCREPARQVLQLLILDSFILTMCVGIFSCIYGEIQIPNEEFRCFTMKISIINS